MAPPRPTPAAIPDGLPAGVVELAASRWRRAQTNTSPAGLRSPDLDDAALDQWLVDELTAPLRLEDWPPPNQPRTVCGGWINDEVIDDDRGAFEAFLRGRPTAGAEAVAAACQELRWPVTPYRPLPHRPHRASVDDHRQPVDPTPAHDPVSAPRSGTAPPLVVDLTTHWAGPLATALLAEAGAEVIKVDPSNRPDGFRDRPALYRHLNGAKQTIDLDLRSGADRDRFEQLISSADLLVESFSRRVLPNLGYGPDALAALGPDIAILSLKAFPAGTPEADWLAYGPGVHAASGLGWPTGTDPVVTPGPAPVAYPDLIAGITAFDAAVELLATDHGGGHDGPATAEVSLAGSIAPLVCSAVATVTTSPSAGDGPPMTGWRRHD